MTYISRSAPQLINCTMVWNNTSSQMFSRKILILGVKMEQQGVHNTCRWLQNQHRQQIDWITNAVTWEISIRLLSPFLVRFKKSFPRHMDIGHFLPFHCLTTVELGRGEGKGEVDEGVGEQELEILGRGWGGGGGGQRGGRGGWRWQEGGENALVDCLKTG